MKKFTIILAVAASVTLAGCSSEEFYEHSPRTTVISVSTGEGTRTTIGDLSEGKRPIYWANGDQLVINGIFSNALTDIGDSVTKTDFIFQNDVTAPYNVLYPASYYKNATTVTLPSVADNMPVPMGATGLSLKPLTGILKITVNQGTDSTNLVQVEVSSATAQLSGDFTINYALGELTGTDNSDAAKTVTLKKNMALSTSTPYEVFVPVPAGTYSFSVKVIDDKGNYMVKSTSSDKLIQAGQISALTSFAFEPTNTQNSTIEIASVQDLIVFAQKVNSGYYDDKPWLFARMTGDITFDATSSKNLHDKNGIGLPEHCFNGTFDGQGFKIKGYVSQDTVQGLSGDSLIVCPIFNFAGPDSYIRNIVLDSSCDIQLPNGNFGTLASVTNGIVENITCNANININLVDGTSNIGGIVGRVCGGSVKNCTMTGNVVSNNTATTNSCWKVGGIAATVEDDGLVENCSFKGYFQWGTANAGNGPCVNNELYISNITAHVMSGNVINCNVAGNPKNDDIRGKSYYQYIGGIAGKIEAECTISGCTNTHGANIRLSSGNEAYIGGIAGRNDGKIAGSSFSAPKEQCTTANVGHTMLAFGGIAGKNNGVLTSCTCTGYLKGPTQYQTTKQAYIGGIAGWTTTDLSELTFNGNMNITVSNTNWGSVTGIVRAVGGVVGYTDDEITLDKLTNKGFVTYSMTSKVNGSGAMVGGIVGYVNGPVTVSNCVNDGYPFNCDFDNTYAPMLKAANAGGIIGSVEGTGTKPATITKCINKKSIGNRRGISGGIVGWAKRANITECESYAGTDAAFMVDGTVSTENITAFLGGIVGKADTLAVISKCKVENVKLCYKPGTTACVTGGIAGALLDATSKIVECTAKDVIIEPQANTNEGSCYYGGIAGTSVADSWIHNCKFDVCYGIKGNTPEPLALLKICSDTNFDDDGNNEVIEE